MTLATVNSNVGSFTNASITVNGKGLITAASSGSATLSKYSSGFVNTDGTTSVANGATLTFTHNLGTTDVALHFYSADDSSGTNLQGVAGADVWSSAYYGCTVTSISTTQVTIQLSANGFWEWSGTGTAVGASWTGHYLKVVAIG